MLGIAVPNFSKDLVLNDGELVELERMGIDETSFHGNVLVLQTQQYRREHLGKVLRFCNRVVFWARANVNCCVFGPHPLQKMLFREKELFSGRTRSAMIQMNRSNIPEQTDEVDECYVEGGEELALMSRQLDGSLSTGSRCHLISDGNVL
ncbi:hypothetical protein Tco_0743848 [Tanacetum coccineum]